jgi:pyrimidine operon attenuation protein/uracil phosphoribosyltransferase
MGDENHMKVKSTVMDAEQMDRTLTRISHEIVERNGGTDNLALIGIRTRGVPLARAIAAKIEEFEGVEIPTGSVDITLYRDDLSQISPNPVVQKTDLPFDLHDQTAVLVDDVLYTGRTVRSALDALTDFGRPRAIQLAVLIDRGHRELPIRADFVGKNVPTSSDELVEVLLQSVDGEDRVVLCEIPDNGGEEAGDDEEGS